MDILGLSDRSVTGIVLILSSVIYFGGPAVTVLRAEFVKALDASTTEMLEIVSRHVPAYQWGFALFGAGVVMTVVGLGLLSILLSAIGHHVLALVAFVGYTFGAVLWMLDLAFDMSVTPWAAREFARTSEVPAFYVPLKQWGETLLCIYTVLAFLSLATYGWGLLQTGLLPAWIGWVSIGWSLLWLAHFALTRDTIPVLHHIIPLLIWIALLVSA